MLPLEHRQSSLREPLPPSIRSLVDLVSYRASADPSWPTYTFLSGDLGERRLANGAFASAVRAIAAHLQRRVRSGERAVLLHPPGLEFITAFHACLHAGVVAVPVYPPDPARLSRTTERIQAIVADSGASVVLTAQEWLPLRDSLSRSGSPLSKLEWIATDTLGPDGADEWMPPALQPESLAFLQYTSGSTSQPKGVRISHRNLLENCRRIGEAALLGPDTPTLLWAPPYHDMGLVTGVICPLYSGYQVRLMSPLDFLSNPLRWLEAISRTGSVVTGAPNFAYELCVRRARDEDVARLDLSRLALAFSAAEPVRAETLDRFCERFAACGFRREAFFSCYGLAEATLLVSAGSALDRPLELAAHRDALAGGRVEVVSADAGPSVRRIVSSGRVHAEDVVKIVDPDSCRVLPDGRVGEIWFAGSSVADGYWNGESAEVFRARTADRDDGAFLRTGDLGFLRNGELYVTGRRKDLIILQGRNLSPEDIEPRVGGSHIHLRPGAGAAFSIDINGEERLFVAWEVELTLNSDVDAIIAAIRGAVSEAFQAHVYGVVLLEPRTIPKTTSGKIQRAACKAAYLEGRLSVVAERRGGLAAGEAQRNLSEGTEACSNPRAAAANDDVAIIGAACRFPGAANLGEFWKVLVEGIDAVRELPPERWDPRKFFDPNPSAPGKAMTRWGGFLEDVDLFDAEFFEISPREASKMDPQHRLLLEVCWEAIEDAGLPANALRGTQTGVYIGIAGSDFTTILMEFEDALARVDPYVGTGNSHSIAANRLSYFLDLRGPSLSVDTACSSALVSVHLACQSLRTGETEAAIAGGVNLTLIPEITIAFSKAQMMAPDGRCKSFSADADGYVRGEGCGIVLLKRLSDAVRDGDRVLGIIRGSATNQDGRTSGIAAPSSDAQAAVIRVALERARVAPAEVGYVEAHGTGTAIGDPVEVGALASAIGVYHSPEQPCRVGSCKAQIGHLETASGIAGLIKVLLCLQHERIPAQLHLSEVSPRLKLASGGLEIATEASPWPRGERPRVAAVSSFGFGGTNAHVVIEEPGACVAPVPSVDRPRHVLTLSAKTEEAVRQLARRMQEHLGQTPHAVADICYTANVGRVPFNRRIAIAASTPSELLEALEVAASGGRCPGLHRADGGGADTSKLAFLFTGQGSQYPGMAKVLYATQPTFRRALERCDAILADQLSPGLLEVLWDEESGRIHDTAYTQPALFAVEWALSELWRSWGVRPAAVLGHSVGEYVAACVAGVLGLEDALRLVALRGRLMQSLDARGAMVTVFADPGQLRAWMREDGVELDVAAENAPEVSVVSGHELDLEKWMEKLGARDVRFQKLMVSCAFHSALMDPILEALQREASRVVFKAPEIPLVSNVTGEFFASGMAPDAEYWRRHARSTVRFADGVYALVEHGCTGFLEIGPHAVLTSLARQTVPGGVATWHASLRKGRDDWDTLADAVASMWVCGVDIDWRAFDRDYVRHKVSLPKYPFQRQRHWGSTTGRWLHSSSPLREDGGSRSGSPLLQTPVQHALPQTLVSSKVGVRSLPYLADHRVHGSAVFPAAGYVEMALQAANRLAPEARARLSGAEFTELLFLPVERDRVVQIVLQPPSAGEVSFQILALPDGSAEDGGKSLWTRHASGTIRLGEGAGERRIGEAPAAILARLEEADVEAHYEGLRRRGLEYGPSFRGISRLWRRDGEALGELKLPDALAAEGAAYVCHPALLDSALQVAAAAVPRELLQKHERVGFIPAGIERVESYARPDGRVYAHVELVVDADLESDTILANVSVSDADGAVVLELFGIRLRRFGGAARGVEPSEPLYREIWQPADASEPEELPTRWLIFADRAGIAEAIAERLAASGHDLALVARGRRFASVGAGRFEIDPAQPSDYQRLLASVGDSGGSLGVVHLWGIDVWANTSDAERDVLTWESALALTQATCAAKLSSTGVWLVTRGAQRVEGERVCADQATLWGFARCAALEHASLRLESVDLEPGQSARDAASDLYGVLVTKSAERELCIRRGTRFVRRLLRCDPQESRSLVRPAGKGFSLDTQGKGRIDRLFLKPRARVLPPPGAIEIEVRAAGLNFRDVMNAMGLYPGAQIPFGAECAGRVTAVGANVDALRPGDDVVGVVPDCFGSHAVTAAALVVRKPAGLSFEDAATLPIAFLTAYYGLHELARLRRGEHVLIHAAAGGVGQAAVQLAKRAGAVIYATAGSPEKRAFLEAQGIEHVFDSRSLEFGDQILARTGGRGVDVVLNSLPGAFIGKSVATLAPYGRFVEIGRPDIFQNAQLDLFPFRNNLAFFAVDLDQLSRDRSAYVGELLERLMEYAGAGELDPLPRSTFPIEESVQAFRYMARRSNIGKVVLSLDARLDRRSTDGAVVRGDALYLVSGGLGSLGLEVARWLAAEGARHLLLVGRSAPTAPALEAVRELRARDVAVQVEQVDVSDSRKVARALERAMRAARAPLAGVIHAAGALDDELLIHQDARRFRRVLAGKLRGARVLDELTRAAPLDFFVLFSSLACVLGSPGQASYAAANAALQAIAQDRRAAGLPAVCIHYGPWEGSGMASRGHAAEILARRGVAAIPREAALDMLRSALRSSEGALTAALVDWQRVADVWPTGAAPALLNGLVKADGARAGGSGTVGSVQQQVLAAPPEMRRALVLERVRAELAVVTGLSPEKLDVGTPLAEIGLDSLMALEFKEGLEAAAGIRLPIDRLMAEPTILTLTDVIVELFEKQSKDPHGDVREA